MSIIDLVNVRQLESTDINFILSSSIKCLQAYSKKLYPAHDVRPLYEHLEKVILSAMHHPSYSILIACNKDDSEQIIGYLMTNPQTNHIYLQYTKYAYRKLGVQSHILMPLLLNEGRPITVEWATKEMIRLKNENRLTVNSQYIEQLIEERFK